MQSGLYHENILFLAKLFLQNFILVFLNCNTPGAYIRINTVCWLPSLESPHQDLSTEYP